MAYIEDPETLGYNAFKDGETESQNPFEEQSDDWKAWNAGYDKAENEAADEEDEDSDDEDE